MHKKIEELEKKIIECTLAKAEECGLEAIDTEELGQITDMIKDLAEARFHEATTKAMEEAEEYYDDMGDQAEHGRMGYDNYRYMRTGRYAPKGRGTYVGRGGYTPMERDYMPYYDDGMGYTEPSASRGRGGGNMGGTERYSDRSSGYGRRMGYSAPTDDYGRTYNEYRNMKEAYMGDKSADNRRRMEDSAKKHVEEAIDNFEEMTSIVDQPTKHEIREMLVKFVNELD